MSTSLQGFRLLRAPRRMMMAEQIYECWHGVCMFYCHGTATNRLTGSISYHYHAYDFTKDAKGRVNPDRAHKKTIVRTWKP